MTNNVADADKDINLEKHQDMRASGDKGQCRCQCAVIKDAVLSAAESIRHVLPPAFSTKHPPRLNALNMFPWL